MKKTLAFDLDDTLYDEADYVRSGLSLVADEFAGELSCSVESLQNLFAQLLHNGGRERIFNRALESLGHRYRQEQIEQMVACYRSQKPQLRLYPGVRSMLAELAQCYRLVLVTDGLPTMQRAKVEGLDISSQFERIIYCWEHDAPKPSAQGYRLAIGDANLSQAAIVGDNPVNDGEPAKALGIPFVRVDSGRFAGTQGGDYLLNSVTELPEVLADVW